MVSVYERGSVYLDQKKFYGKGISDLCATLYYSVQFHVYRLLIAPSIIDNLI